MMLLERLCYDKGWDLDSVNKAYQYGIDWSLLRSTLRELADRPAERHALFIVATGACWSDNGRWRASMQPTGTCSICLSEHGDDRHHLYGCIGMLWHTMEAKLMGRIPPIKDDVIYDQCLAPLIDMGLPPRERPWEPCEVEFHEGDIAQGLDCEFFGDGSGLHQNAADEQKIATWSLVTVEPSRGGYSVAGSVRGNVTGWKATVPRGELEAYNEFLRRAGPNAVYVGDCKGVIDAATWGAPKQWASSRHINADLWRETRRLQQDREVLPRAEKIAAHRSRSAAADEGEDSLRKWVGNNEADRAAKSLAHSLDKAADVIQEAAERRDGFRDILVNIATAAAWNLKHRPTALAKVRKQRRPQGVPAQADGVHDLRERATGGWECRKCRGFALSRAGRRQLRSRPCLDVRTEQIHASHVVRQGQGVLWCSRCGCYTTRWPRELRRQCAGRPSSEAQANVLHRLMRGPGPTTASYLDDVRDEEERDSRANGSRVDGATPARRSGDGGPRPASAPCGRYLRLRGGPLYRPARMRDGLEQRLATAVDGPAISRMDIDPPASPRLADGDVLDGDLPGDLSGDFAGYGDDGNGMNNHGCSLRAGIVDGMHPIRDATCASELEESVGDQVVNISGSAEANGGEERERSLSSRRRQKCNVSMGSREGRLENEQVVHSRPPRRRLRGKQSVPSANSAAAIAERASSPPSKWCLPMAEDSWSARVRPSSHGYEGCKVCYVRTRLRCRGCEAAICITCVRHRTACPPT